MRQAYDLTALAAALPASKATRPLREQIKRAAGGLSIREDMKSLTRTLEAIQALDQNGSDEERSTYGLALMTLAILVYCRAFVASTSRSTISITHKMPPELNAKHVRIGLLRNKSIAHLDETSDDPVVKLFNTERLVLKVVDNLAVPSLAILRANYIGQIIHDLIDLRDYASSIVDLEADRRLHELMTNLVRERSINADIDSTLRNCQFNPEDYYKNQYSLDHFWEHRDSSNESRNEFTPRPA